jgi:hypothetical protein
MLSQSQGDSDMTQYIQIGWNHGWWVDGQNRDTVSKTRYDSRLLDVYNISHMQEIGNRRLNYLFVPSMG